MMTQSTYASTCDCTRPLPLIRTNYLSEFRTETEKAKARENLGIADSQTLQWKNITGNIEDNPDIKAYVESKLKYELSNEYLEQDITTIQEAIDYVVKYIIVQESQGLTVEQLKENCESLRGDLNALHEDLDKDISKNSQSIGVLSGDINDINNQIKAINEAIQAIDVQALSLDWIKSALQNSKTIEIVNDEVIEVKVSQIDNNAVEAKVDGIYVKDSSKELQEEIDDLNAFKTASEEHFDNIDDTLESFRGTFAYSSKLPDDTVSSQFSGVTVGQLKDKSLTDLIDTLFFPVTVRALKYPSVSYYGMPSVVEVGTSIASHNTSFNRGDAGEVLETTSQIRYNGSTFEGTTYTEIGTYTFNTVVKYDTGEYITDSHGNVTNKRIEAGSVSTNANVIATYPWFAGNSVQVNKQGLVPFNQTSSEFTFTMNLTARLLLPGNNSTIISFKLDSGLGFQDVNMDDWISDTIDYNGYTYKRWTKKSSYAQDVTHKIIFKLVA